MGRHDDAQDCLYHQCFDHGLQQLHRVDLIRQHQAQWQQAETAPDLERFEQELHDHVMAVELQRYDVSADEVTVGGLVYHQSLESTETYQRGWLEAAWA